MSRRWTLLLLLVTVFLFAACGSGDALTDGFSEEEVKEKAEEILEMLHAQDTEGILENSTETLKQALNEETMQQVYALIAEAGTYDSIEEMSVAGTTNKENNEELAVTAVKAKYELKNITYTLSFTKQMKLAGLFLK